MFNIGQRLTPHARHRQKHVDVPVTESRAFQFAGNGSAPHSTHTPAVRGRTRAWIDARARRLSPSR